MAFLKNFLFSSDIDCTGVKAGLTAIIKLYVTYYILRSSRFVKSKTRKDCPKFYSVGFRNRLSSSKPPHVDKADEKAYSAWGVIYKLRFENAD
jgi:hypothetical protein